MAALRQGMRISAMVVAALVALYVLFVGLGGGDEGTAETVAPLLPTGLEIALGVVALTGLFVVLTLVVAAVITVRDRGGAVSRR